ncbi:MAG: cysteine methyltransferase [Flavobacteriia bacterium]|nr:MAG: cysteine methyltransferase [Flavobacteriia bacterium]
MNNLNFFERVYTVVRKIPYGKVTTYGIIATYLGAPRSARMVGWALNNSKNDPTVPAHRVVNRKGLLTGKNHFHGTNLMKQLLENEGITIQENCIQNLDAYLWYPEKTK